MSSSRGSTSSPRVTPLTVSLISVTGSGLLRAVSGPDSPPDPLRGGGHVDVRDAEVRYRVDDRVLHRGRRTDRASLADALGAERVIGRGGLHGDELEARDLGRGQERVVGERGGQRVAVIVVDDLFEERLRGALCD